MSWFLIWIYFCVCTLLDMVILNLLYGTGKETTFLTIAVIESATDDGSDVIARGWLSCEFCIGTAGPGKEQCSCAAIIFIFDNSPSTLSMEIVPNAQTPLSVATNVCTCPQAMSRTFVFWWCWNWSPIGLGSVRKILVLLGSSLEGWNPTCPQEFIPVP